MFVKGCTCALILLIFFSAACKKKPQGMEHENARDMISDLLDRDCVRLRGCGTKRMDWLRSNVCCYRTRIRLISDCFFISLIMTAVGPSSSLRMNLCSGSRYLYFPRAMNRVPSFRVPV